MKGAGTKPKRRAPPRFRTEDQLIQFDAGRQPGKNGTAPITTWFFEQFLSRGQCEGYTPSSLNYAYLFKFPIMSAPAPGTARHQATGGTSEPARSADEVTAYRRGMSERPVGQNSSRRARDTLAQNGAAGGSRAQTTSSSIREWADRTSCTPFAQKPRFFPPAVCRGMALPGFPTARRRGVMGRA